MDKREVITTSNLGPVVSVLAWIVQATVAVAVSIKFTLSSIISGKRNREDIPLLLATAFDIGFTVSISLAVPNGVGRHEKTLSLNQLESLQKALYTANILFVSVLAFAQASVLILFHELTPDRVYKKAVDAIAAFITLFALASLLVVIFPCHPPRVWGLLGTGCIDQTSFWKAFAGMNIFIETALVLFPIFLIYPLKVKKGRKTILVSCFAVRLIVVGGFAVQIYEAQSLNSQLSDWTFDSWKFILAMVVVQGLSIITVCIPYIRNLLLSIESGMIQTGHVRLQSRPSVETSFPLCHIPTSRMTSDTASIEGSPKRGQHQKGLIVT
ncbi:hypothetical protein F5Y07DRAFT_356397 [Xylaria sp. FL0933]|nr:hypothetical protein F5Y07DRAFT_356397 [Xylaria sp. FL0933]